MNLCGDNFARGDLKDDVKKKLSGFGQLENGNRRITRQVSIKLRKSVMKKSLPAEKWRISARQIKVRFRHGLKIFNVKSVQKKV